VQKRNLLDLVETDMRTLKVVVLGLERYFDGLEISWLLPELEGALKQELDFVAEGSNSEKAGKMMKTKGCVLIF